MNVGDAEVNPSVLQGLPEYSESAVFHPLVLGLCVSHLPPFLRHLPSYRKFVTFIESRVSIPHVAEAKGWARGRGELVRVNQLKS